MLSRFLYFAADFWPFCLLILATIAISILIAFKIFKSDVSQTKKGLSLSLLSFFIFLVSAFVLFEAYFRYIYDQSDGLGFLKVNAKWHQRHVVHNAYFFRDRDFDPNKKEGITRIAVIGDSIAFGGGIEKVEDRFSNILEKKLVDANRQAEVYNLGKPGYDTEAEINQYNQVKNLNFDIIVWQYFLNDVQPLEKSTGTSIIAKNSQKEKFVKALTYESYFLDFLYWRFSQKYQNTFSQLKDADIDQYKNEEVAAKHKQQIADFIKSIKDEDKKIVVIIFPFINLIGPNYPAQNIHIDLKTYFENQQVDVIDLLDHLKDQNPQTLVAGKFDAHPNEYVHNLAAQKLFEKVEEYLK